MNLYIRVVVIAVVRIQVNKKRTVYVSYYPISLLRSIIMSNHNKIILLLEGRSYYYYAAKISISNSSSTCYEYIQCLCSEPFNVTQ